MKSKQNHKFVPLDINIRDIREYTTVAMNVPNFGLVMTPRRYVMFNGSRTVVKMEAQYCLNGEKKEFIRYGKATCHVGDKYSRGLGIDLALRRAAIAIEQHCIELMIEFSYTNRK